MELKAGDTVRFTRNDGEAGRINGARGEVLALDRRTRTAIIRTSSGRTETLNLDTARDRHIAHAYVDTAFAAQGRTATHVMIHSDSKATTLVDQKSVYVGLFRATEAFAIFHDDRGESIHAISEWAGHLIKEEHRVGEGMGDNG